MPGPGLGRRGALRLPAHTDPGDGPERRAGRARDGRVRGDQGAGDAGGASGHWTGEVGAGAGPGWLGGGGPAARSRRSCAGSPWVEILLGLQTFPKSVLYGHGWILPYTGLVLAPVMLCFLHARSFMFLLPRAPGEGKEGVVGLQSFSSVLWVCSFSPLWLAPA